MPRRGQECRSPECGNRITEFLSGLVDLIAFEPNDAEDAGIIRAALERAGTLVGPYDALIAG